MRKQQKIINLFGDTSIYAIKEVISIADEEDLNQLWEHITTHHTHETSKSYPFFISLYELSERFLASFPQLFFEIIVEQSDEFFYFTVWNREFCNFVGQHWEKRGIEHLSDTKKITAKLHKPIIHAQDNREEIRINHLLSTIQVPQITQYVPAYTFMDLEDLHELKELSEDLSEHLHQIRHASLSNDAFIRMRSYFSLICVILNHYEQVEEMALIMSEFSMMINQNKEDFCMLNEDQVGLIEGFTHNFKRWLTVLFIQGGAQIGFMNNSMRADMETIRAITQPHVQSSEEDLDAIFDF
jgi:hypothetical protein